MLRQLRHPHIVRLCDVLEMADCVFVVMERVEGHTQGTTHAVHLSSVHC